MLAQIMQAITRQGMGIKVHQLLHQAQLTKMITGLDMIIRLQSTTQININIDKLAHFDRTTVAASAEERDLIAAMENKITEAVYRIFAEASNQAQSIIDLT